MKTETFWKWSLGLALAVLPLAGGCDQESANSAPVISSNTNQPSGAEMGPITNAASPEAAEQELEDAPGQVASTAAAPPQSVHMSSPANEIAKLAQAGLDESVMLSYVANSAHTFNLSSDAIIYLNDIGVPGTVVTAMIQHDQSIRESSASYAAPPVYSNQTVPAAGTPTPYPPPNAAPETSESQAPPPQVVESGQPPEQVNGSSSYFYDSLAPYGNWIEVGGYGLCWQPTVVVVNPGWRPYCDRGHWAYTDCGWYWVSGYSWGWAPFHYGRWFHHNRWGWCWAPDTVWGPAWVSWRYSPDYCGWAPLPPTACFTPGIGFTYFGRHVGFGFSFGLSADVFSFVAFDQFTDRRWHEHCVPAHDVRGFFNRTVIANNVVEHNKTIINEGIPVSRIVAATHREIPRIHIRDAADPASARPGQVERAGGSLAVFRPNLPPPAHQTSLVGQGIRPQIHAGTIPRAGRTPTTVNNGTTRPLLGTITSTSRRTEAAPVFRNQPTPAQNQVRPGHSEQGSGPVPAPGNTAPLIQRSWDRSSPSTTERQPVQRESSQPMLNRSAQPATPGQQPTPAVRNNSRVSLQNWPQPTVRAESPPPAQTQPQPQNPRVFRQQAPKYMQQDQRVFTAPGAPVHSQPPVRTYQWAPAAEPREQQRWVSPVQRSAPSFHSEPAPSTPSRVESTPSSQRNYSAPPASRGSGQDSNSRRNR